MRNPFRRKNRIRSDTRPLLLVGGVLAALCMTFAAVAVYEDPSAYREAYEDLSRSAAGLARGVNRVAEDLAAYFLERPYFAVQEIKVFGAVEADRADLIASAGLKRGLSIWRIDPQGLEQKIGRHPWVKQVVVRRDLPRRVIIEVEEWKAAGILALENLYYVDAEGVVFKTVAEADAVDFPLITGLRAADLPAHDPSTRSKLAEVLALGREVERSGLRLSEIRFGPRGDVVLYPASARVPFAMGWGGWSGKLLRLKRFLKAWDGQEAHFAAVDMSFAGQAVARLRRSL